jgi:RND family efflux transporter MFP subunit
MRFTHSLVACTLIAALGLNGSGCNHETAAESRETDDSAAVNARVTAAAPQLKTLTLFTSQPGRIEAFEEAPLHSKVSGYIAEVKVDIGDEVTEGQVLIELWVPELDDELHQKEALQVRAAAEVQQAAAAVIAAQAAVTSANAQVTQAQSGVTRAEADLAYRAQQLERLTQLAADGSVENRLVDEAQNQWAAAGAAVDEAHANVASAEAALAEAEAKVGQAQADQTASEAQLQVAGADHQRALTMSGYAQIKAPFDGIITYRSVDDGHYVHPPSVGTTPALLVVTQTEQVRLFVDVPETEAAFVDAGDAVMVRVPALAGEEIEASVTRTSWSLDISNRSLLAEIDILNPEGDLRPGMFTTANICLEERADVLTLPVTAIAFEGHEAACWCVESGHVTRKPVQIGLRVSDQVQILSGLTADEVVVQRGIEALTEGQAVDVVAPE